MNSVELKKTDFISGYIAWLRSNMAQAKINDAISVVTPFLDLNNDFIEFFITKIDGDFLLDDDGATITGLELSGFDFDSRNGREMIIRLANSFGIHVVDKNLRIHTDASSIFLKMHMFMQGLMRISDSFTSAPPALRGLFLDEVKLFLDESDVRFSEAINLQGESGLMHRYDYIIPHSRVSAEKLVSVLSSPSVDKVKSHLFAVHDIRPVRTTGFDSYLVLNDQSKSVKREILQAIGNSGVKPILWSERSQFAKELSA